MLCKLWLSPGAQLAWRPKLRRSSLSVGTSFLARAKSLPGGYIFDADWCFMACIGVFAELPFSLFHQTGGHFLDSIVSMSRDIVDSVNALEEMAKETPFSKEQRDTMMHGNDVASVGSGTKLQSHPNLAGFLTESLWSVLFDAHLSWDHMRVVCQTLH